ncbi:YaeQ family protein [Arsukibacterium sp.]|uniref:YaeQ family protein n=1 Tax=Arsukibacterium sp. TaxID=1977258 RepID=UPI002FDA5CE1
MRMNTKVVRLDLGYYSELQPGFSQQRHYIAPYPQEEASHFVRRLLAYLIMYEQQPQLSKTATPGKEPDVFVQDTDAHFRLWGSVDVLSDKKLRRACHLADEVWFFISELDQPKLQHLPYQMNAHCYHFDEQQLLQLQQMLKPHMRLSVWRDTDTLTIADGEHWLEFLLQLAALH